VKKTESSADRHTRTSPGKAPATVQAPHAPLVPPRRFSLVRLLLLSAVAGVVLLAPPLFGAAAQTIDVEIKGIAAAGQPRMLDDILILTFAQAGPTRSVAARFQHEGWAQVHQFSRNENGVFVLDYPVPEGVRQLRYRIGVDGLWARDPANPRVETDELGVEYSLFTLERDPPRVIGNPRREPDGRLTFTFRAPAASRVAIAGDWNGWDPFADYLAEIEPGVFRISLRMRPGRHFYYFVADGRRTLDAYNPATGTDPDGRAVSSF
jgi:hypothetical protein